MLSERRTSQDAEALANRIAANNIFGSADLTAWLLDHLDLFSGERLLDLGCGTGKHLSAFAHAGARCTGIDIAKASLKDAAALCGLDVVLLRQSIDDLSSIAGPFDTITAIYALYYSPDVRSTLEQARNLLARDGRIAVFGPYADNNAVWFDFIGQFMTLPPNVSHSTTHFMFDDVLRFAYGNFAKIRCERFENLITIPSHDELRRYWRSNIYYCEELDPEFEKAAERHFAANASFVYRKVGLLIEMRE